MISQTTPATDAETSGTPPPGTGILPQPVILVVAAGLLVAGDWLLWDSRPGIALAVFGLLILLAVASLAPPGRIAARHLAGLAGAVAGLLAVAEYVQPLSVAFMGLGLILLALSFDERVGDRLSRNAHLVLVFPFLGAARLVQDMAAAGQKLSRRAWSPLNLAADWVLPAVIGLVFLGLFALANPVIETWLDELARIDVPIDESLRLLFWAMILILVWPFLRTAACAWPVGWRADLPAPGEFSTGGLISTNSIRNALILFNGLFAVQTGLDATYLWSGATLPEGMTYAEYAHRGAYPLVVTALLAGAIVIGVTTLFRPDRLMRRLILVWIAQNVALLGSSVLRLNLYVAAYSLTYLRIAAFIWMGLLAAGFLVLVARLVLGKSNRWMVAWNAGLAGAVLYASCFVNFADAIARYNIAHSSIVDLEAGPLDTRYLCGLGPQALLAVLEIEGLATTLRCGGRPIAEHLAFDPPDTWRGWTFRDWRLSGYLAETGLEEERVSHGWRYPGR
ncbi:MAG: DUF4173 domain-containing protein [Paracoccaceae bacterium]|nr:DUF4173 domain-containing protein [Paracoccaceae bacterium]